MPDDEFAEVGGHRRQLALIAASAFSVVVLVAAGVIGVHSWRDTAARSPAADGTATPTSSESQSASSVASPSAFGASEPVFSSAPAVSPAPISSLPSPSASATARHTSPTVPLVADESHLNFSVSVRLSPTHVMLGQQTRVTVTVLNAGGGVDPDAEVSIGSMVPSDDFSDAPSTCAIGNGGVQCPIPRLQAGHKATIAFTVATGYYPGDTWDDEIFGQLTYADSFGQPQELQPGYSADLLVGAGTPSSTPPASSASSTAPPAPSSTG